MRTRVHACLIACLLSVLPCSLAGAYEPDARPVEIASIQNTWHDAARNRDVPFKIYFPKPDAAAHPVVVFSHGLGGSRDGYRYLGEYWAGHGFVCVHLQHMGSDTAVLVDGLKDGQGPQQTMRRAAMDPRNAIDRAKDVNFAIDQLKRMNDDARSPLHGRLDLAKIGVAGHSFGGHTTMVIAGQSMAGQSLLDPRVKAAIAMSPPAPVMKANADRIYDGVHIPVFVLTGTNDNSPIGATTAEDRRIAFDHLHHADGYLLTFAGGDHMLFSGRLGEQRPPTDDRYHALIQQCTTAYWDAYLNGNADARRWLKEQFPEALADGGTFEMK